RLVAGEQAMGDRQWLAVVLDRSTVPERAVVNEGGAVNRAAHNAGKFRKRNPCDIDRTPDGKVIRRAERRVGEELAVAHPEHHALDEKAAARYVALVARKYALRDGDIDRGRGRDKARRRIDHLHATIRVVSDDNEIERQ